jgi:hypothetical protein
VRPGTTASIIAGLIAAMVVAGSAFAGTATGAKLIPFTAKYAGTAVTSVNDNIVDISATGTGLGQVIGAGKIVGKGTGDTAQQPCVPFSGTGSMTGTARTTITFRVLQVSRGCGDEAGEVFSVVGKATVLKATGKLLNAKGTLKFTGTYTRSSGAFSVKFTGTLTK